MHLATLASSVMRMRDYARRVLTHWGPFTLISAAWEHQWSIFKDGRCIATRNSRDEAFTYCKENQDA